jgi:hypothetical protein
MGVVRVRFSEYIHASATTVTVAAVASSRYSRGVTARVAAHPARASRMKALVKLRMAILPK